METKRIILDGGPYHDVIREVENQATVLEYHEIPESETKKALEGTATGNVEVIRRYYKKSSKFYQGMEVFVWIELNPKKDESNKEDTQTT